MSQQQFKIGDRVVLKSGGPDMTVTNVGDQMGRLMVWCSWFDGMKPSAATFPPDALELA